MKSWRDELNDVEIEKRRFAILAHLEQSGPTRSLNADILMIGCRAAGVPTNSEEMQDALLWLEERHYIKTESLGGMLVATITSVGREVARGIRKVPGLIPFGLDG